MNRGQRHRLAFGAPYVIVEQPAEADLQKITTKLFGRSIDAGDLADFVAAPRGSRIRVSIDEDKVLQVHVTDAALKLTMIRDFHQTDGKTWVDHVFFQVDGQKGFGRRIFARAVKGYRDLGLDRIHAKAQGRPGDPNFIGYYVWPRFGFNMELSPTIKEKLAASVPGRTFADLSALIITPNGADWWKNNGEEGYMKFDLSENSLSNVILEAYLASKKQGTL